MTTIPYRARTLSEILAMPGPLSARLDAFSETLKAEEAPYVAEYDALVARLVAGQIGKAAPRPGDLMPPFILPDPHGVFVDMGDLLGEGPLVVSFNRGHWCEFCQIELDALATAADEVAALGGRIVSIMPDRAPYTLPLMQRLGNKVPILSDIGNGYALENGIVLFVGDKVREMMVAEDLHVDRVQGEDSWFMPLPATFVIGRDGRVAARHVDPDFRTRMEVESILATLAGLPR